LITGEVGDYTLPTDIGTDGYVLTSDGMGSSDWQLSGGGGFDQSLNTTDEVEFKSASFVGDTTWKIDTLALG
jgi:hypothetical protein